MNRASKGFTLVEALASVLLISVGIVGVIVGLGAMARSDSKALETEEMQRLAYHKYDEVVALGILPAGDSSGDFEDIGEKRFVWRAERTTIGPGNLDGIKVFVDRPGNNYQKGVEVQGVFCKPVPKDGQ